MKVMIVDDSAQMRTLLRSVLRGVAQEVVECDDGSDAPAAYAEHCPDWVLMDVEMQRMDGLAATAAITRAHPEARVLIVTNHEGVGLRRAAERAGACGYVLKENLLDLRTVLETTNRDHTLAPNRGAGAALRRSPRGNQ